MVKGILFYCSNLLGFLLYPGNLRDVGVVRALGGDVACEATVETKVVGKAAHSFLEGEFASYGIHRFLLNTCRLLGWWRGCLHPV